jgi:hypothetical protein
VSSPEYSHFWQRLARGESFSGKFLRLAKGNRSVWLEASYIPVSDRRGRVIRVIKIAADISERVHSALEQEAVVNAINRSMAIITFNPKGSCLKQMKISSMPLAINGMKSSVSIIVCFVPRRFTKVMNTDSSGRG